MIILSGCSECLFIIYDLSCEPGRNLLSFKVSIREVRAVQRKFCNQKVQMLVRAHYCDAV